MSTFTNLPRRSAGGALWRPCLFWCRNTRRSCRSRAVTERFAVLLCVFAQSLSLRCFMTIRDVHLKTGSLRRAVCWDLKALASTNGVPRSDRRTQRLFLFRINLFIISVWMVSSAKPQVGSAVVISLSCRFLSPGRTSESQTARRNKSSCC